MSAVKNIFYLLGSARSSVSRRLENAIEYIKNAKDMARIKWTRISIERLENSLVKFESRESEDAKKVRKHILLEYETLISYLRKNGELNDAAVSMLRVYGSDDLSSYVYDSFIVNCDDENAHKKQKALQRMRIAIETGRSPWATSSHNMRKPEP